LKCAFNNRPDKNIKYKINEYDDDDDDDDDDDIVFCCKLLLYYCNLWWSMCVAVLCPTSAWKPMTSRLTTSGRHLVLLCFSLCPPACLPVCLDVCVSWQHIWQGA